MGKYFSPLRKHLTWKEVLSKLASHLQSEEAHFVGKPESSLQVIYLCLVWVQDKFSTGRKGALTFHYSLGAQTQKRPPFPSCHMEPRSFLVSYLEAGSFLIPALGFLSLELRCQLEMPSLFTWQSCWFINNFYTRVHPSMHCWHLPALDKITGPCSDNIN